MSDYFTTISKIVEQAEIHENALPLKNPACRSKFFFHLVPTTKVFLLLHGFTAGPYQFEPLGKALFTDGYNVLVPLQPGHGVAGDWNQDNPPPLPTEPQVYQEFALSWLKVAENLGQEVIVGGLSTGGVLAAWLSLQCPQKIERALLFAPYFSGNNAIVNFLVEILPIYYEWLNKDNPGNFGYKGFRMPALRLFLDMAKEILQRVENEKAVPMLIISSEADAAIDEKELDNFFANILKQPSWYHRFDKEFNIPHTMMTSSEGNKYQDLLIAIIKAYIESNITWTELLQIGKLILQGLNFDNAVQSLQLQQKLSPDVSVLLTIMNKKLIINSEKR